VKKTFTILIITLSAVFSSFGQNYEQAAGIRLGAAGGISYRRLLGADAAGEIMLLSQNHGSVVVLLFEKQKPAILFDDLHLTFIYGVGAHFGVTNTHRQYNNADVYDQYPVYNTPQLGFDGFASFEYMMPRYPVALSLECKPYFEFFDSGWLGLHIPVVAFGARYTF